MIALPLPLRRMLFRGLERMSLWRSGTGSAAPASAAPSPAKPQGAADGRSLWIFVSTIGELNAIQPFLTALLAHMGQPPLTLISDRHTYDDAYRTRYPHATVEQLDGSTPAVLRLLQRRPPLMLLVAEIPCLLHDAPCRFSFATVDVVKRSGAPVVLVNGWLYGYPPPSRLDQIEHRMFSQDYVRAFDLITVQTPDVRERLLAVGAADDRVAVTGNIKFDALFDVPPPATALAQALLARRRAGPVIVAGSITEPAHQQALVDAFVTLRQTHADALLVLAPRHPENQERMAALAAALAKGGLDWRLRSTNVDSTVACGGAVLVLDTMGELRGCYAAATLAFVGTDHNVLEPLAFGTPVFVFDGWNETYPSFPVFSQLRKLKLLNVTADASDLASAWASSINDWGPSSASAVTLQDLRGAVERNLDALDRSAVLQRVKAVPPG